MKNIYTYTGILYSLYVLFKPKIKLFQAKKTVFSVSFNVKLQLENMQAIF